MITMGLGGLGLITMGLGVQWYRVLKHKYHRRLPVVSYEDQPDPVAIVPEGMEMVDETPDIELINQSPEIKNG